MDTDYRHFEYCLRCQRDIKRQQELNEVDCLPGREPCPTLTSTGEERQDEHRHGILSEPGRVHLRYAKRFRKVS